MTLPPGLVERLSVVQSRMGPIHRLQALRELEDDLERMVLETVREARERDYSWAAIATPLRTSKQHAHRTFAPRLAKRRRR